MNKERALEILERFKTDKSLFNWCPEYDEFVNKCVHFCVTSEIDYILKKSYEDSEAPLSYEDLDLFDSDTARDLLLYEWDNIPEELKHYSNNVYTYNRRVKNKGDFEVFLKSLSKSELQDMVNEFSSSVDVDSCNAEIYEWWVISDPLLYCLEQSGEIILNGFWGRQTTGQSIKLDNCVMEAFISVLRNYEQL